jgi:Carbohydrate esterase, sialic acid-specific acetylesterase
MPGVVQLPTRVISIVGQSQGTNALGPTLYTIRNTSVLKQLNINDGTVSPASEPFLGVTGSVSTFFAQMADELADTKRWGQLILAPISVAATYSAEWVPGGDCYGRVTTIISQIKALNLSVGIIIWLHGEEDSQHMELTATAYISNVRRGPVAAFRAAGIRAPVIVPLETRVLGGLPTNSPAIRGAQKALVDPDARIVLGPDLDGLDNAYRQDGTHFNDPGKSAVAKLFAPVVAQWML